MKPIALVLALYMFFGSLFPKTDFSQLLKLANVVDHYRVHEALARGEGEFFSSWQFLKMHFLAPDDHQHDQGNSHCQLPLHSVHTTTLLNNQLPSLPVIFIPSMLTGKKIFHYVKWAAIHFPDGIFHPPVVG